MVNINKLNAGDMTLTTGPAGHPETRFTLDSGTVETYNITGTLNTQWFIDHEYYDAESHFNETIVEVEIGNTVTSIGNYAFQGCNGIVSITIPDSVTSIGDSAFENTSITSMTIPNRVTSIGVRAFHDCDELASVTIPLSVTSIGGNAFFNCGGMTENGLEITLLSRTKEQAETLSPETWGCADGTIIHCSDEDITISGE